MTTRTSCKPLHTSSIHDMVHTHIYIYIYTVYIWGMQIHETLTHTWGMQIHETLTDKETTPVLSSWEEPQL